MAARKERKTALPDSIYEISILNAKGDLRTLGDYKGDVLLIVNTASY